jgi:hypothetical protein
VLQAGRSRVQDPVRKLNLLSLPSPMSIGDRSKNVSGE